MLLLSIYNATYFLLNSYVTHNIQSSFIVAILMFLFAMFLLTAFNILEKVREIETEHRRKEAKIEHEIKNEYRNVYRIHQRKELFKKAVSLSKQGTNINDLGVGSKVYIDYLNRTDINT